jgi:transketolase
MPRPNSDLRQRIVDLVCSGGGGHIPSSFSIVDILDCVYSKYIGSYSCHYQREQKYTFTLSKGHAACALYSVLHKYGYLTTDDLETYLQYSSILGGHPDSTKVPGAEASTGSLGHGLPFTVGRALAAKIAGSDKLFFVLVGDGECHEGTIWESAIVANNLNLSNLVVLVDHNKSSDQICPHNSLYEQFQAFGWYCLESDGHDPEQINAALQKAVDSDKPKPRVIVFNTIKGYGVPMLEGHGPWHYKIPNSEELSIIHEALNS